MTILIFSLLTIVSKALTRRIGVMKKFNLPTEVGDARINAVRPLRVDAENPYGIIFAPTLNKLVIGKGMS